MQRELLTALTPCLLSACVIAHGHRHATLVPVPDLEHSLVQPSPVELSVLYVTDRRDLNTDIPARAYGYDRGVAVRVGTARLTIGRGRTREALYLRTSTPGRRDPWRLRIDGLQEHGTLRDGSLTDQVARRLANEPAGGDVYLSIQGIGAGFADSLYDLAQVWHHLGRRGVPVAYSWPSGRGGFIQNVYQYERDSGDFTIPHLKRTLRLLASIDTVQRIHVIAHSRGTAILIDALRELGLEMLAEGRPLDAMKLATLVLAAPDFDIGLFELRILDEGVLDIATQTTLFVSDRDIKLMASGWMHGGPRVGGSGRDAIEHLAAGNGSLAIEDVSDVPRGNRHDHHLTAPDAFARLLRLLAEPPPSRSVDLEDPP